MTAPEPNNRPTSDLSSVDPLRTVPPLLPPIPPIFLCKERSFGLATACASPLLFLPSVLLPPSSEVGSGEIWFSRIIDVSSSIHLSCGGGGGGGIPCSARSFPRSWSSPPPPPSIQMVLRLRMETWSEGGSEREEGLQRRREDEGTREGSKEVGLARFLSSILQSLTSGWRVGWLAGRHG